MNHQLKIGYWLILALIIGFWPAPVLAGYTGYSWRASLTIPYTWFATDLTNFPVLITASSVPAALFDYANADGGDIRFSTDTAGDSPLNREIVAYDNTADTMEAWVKVPSVSSTTDTVIYIWYGNSGASEPAANDADEGSQGVWDANFVGIYHLQEAVNNDPNGYLDSTSNAKHLTGSNMASTSLAGPWIGGLAAVFDGVDDVMTGGVSAIQAPPWSASAWVKHPSIASGAQLVRHYADNNNYVSLLLGTSWNQTVLTAQVYPIQYGSAGAAAESASISANTWTHVAGNNQSATSRYAYKNGVAGSQNTTSKWPAGTLSLYIGVANGPLDEIRISNVTRSAAWYAAEYNSGISPGSITDGTPEDPNAGAVSRVIRLSGGLRLLGGIRFQSN